MQSPTTNTVSMVNIAANDYNFYGSTSRAGSCEFAGTTATGGTGTVSQTFEILSDSGFNPSSTAARHSHHDRSDRRPAQLHSGCRGLFYSLDKTIPPATAAISPFHSREPRRVPSAPACTTRIRTPRRRCWVQSLYTSATPPRQAPRASGFRSSSMAAGCTHSADPGMGSVINRHHQRTEFGVRQFSIQQLPGGGGTELRRHGRRLRRLRSRKLVSGDPECRRPGDHTLVPPSREHPVRPDEHDRSGQ